MKRNKCVLCDSNLEEFYKINNMPSFMGVVESNQPTITADMGFAECVNCGLLQTTNLLDTNLVYLNNHNIEIVGDIWEEHYSELSNFIKNKSKGDVVFEIGDPSAKIAKQLNKFYKKWIIIEPNPNIEDFDNVEIVEGFFTGGNPTDYDISTIIHSHVFEHIYDPIDFLNNCNSILQDGGVTIFSIPNIKWLLENNALPTGILHFEHTYYINEDNIELFLNNCGFVLDEIQYYKNHSLFIKATKTDNIDRIDNYEKVNDKDKFLNLINFYDDKIKYINEELGIKKYYLYSAHINSQYLLNVGISNNIKGLLDKSESKIGKKLYGYDYDIFEPMDIVDVESPIVVASHMGAYYEEIRENLLKLNKNAIIL